MLIGIDIGGTKCAVVLGRTDGESIEILQKQRFDTPPNAPVAVLARLDSIIARYISEFEVFGIGISCGGPLDSKRGLILSPPNLPGWDNIEIVRYFHEKYQIPVCLQNDADACAIAEWRFGAGKGTQNLIFLTFGTGLGAGLILNGTLYSGTNDMAGELGHWRMEKDGPIGYGKAGSFEGFCSGSGIAAQGRTRAEAGQCPKLMEAAGSLENITAKLIGDLAERGNADCTQIYADCGKALGKGLALLIDLLNPQVIVIGSIFTRSQTLLWPYAKEVIEQEALALSLGVCEVKSAALGDSIGDYAALAVAGQRRVCSQND
ncbi:MAG: ROK family protein [Oscillospiraceae bacterium]|jgi:glucokinase|nr:ROK family protein [Oscillospiraceae bacterium]